MGFSLGNEQRELKAAAVAFARRELDQDLATREEAGEFSSHAWRACAQFGIQGLPVPDELLGSRLRAVISADGGLTRDEVLDHRRQRLPGPGHIVPDVVEFCEALPRTSAGRWTVPGL